jgi:hypothetical protein
MQIRPEQVAQQTRVDDAHGLVKALKDAGVKDPKIVLVFDSNEGEADENAHRWKVRVFYHSPTELDNADLAVPVVLKNVKIMADDKEVIRTIYPDGYIGWCGKINGQQVWIT